MSVTENIRDIRERIRRASARGRFPEKEPRLIAVSKTKPLPMLQEAYQAGIRDFGENRVQELVEKWEAMPKDIRWHMIGHLQRNKVKYVVDKAYLIHSVDSLRLAQEISREAVKRQLLVNILVEVNAAQEASKFGSSCRETLELVEQIARLPGIRVKGLMTVAPYVEDPEENRPYFVILQQLAVDIRNKNIDNVDMEYLSMGMTGDFEVAVEEGADYVRVGTGIFGEREYPPAADCVPSSDK